MEVVSVAVGTLVAQLVCDQKKTKMLRGVLGKLSTPAAKQLPAVLASRTLAAGPTTEAAAEKKRKILLQSVAKKC